MNNYLKKFRDWFEVCNFREKMLVCALSWALLYALFAVTAYRPLDIESKQLEVSIKKTQDQIASWKTQLKFLNDIPSTPLYKEWISHHKDYQSLKEKHQAILGTPTTANWDDVIKTILGNYPRITIGNIRSEPGTVYQSSKIQSGPDSIYQKKMRLTVHGSFHDIVGYLAYLEKSLPNIRWNTLNYEVKEYPMAEVQMEFSILYEKSII